MNNGTKVTTAAQWTARRAEIKELFDREVYGRVPRNMPAVKWEVVSSEKGLPMGGGGFGGATPQPISDIPVITKQLVGRVDNSSYPAITVNIGMTLVTPANATGPVPDRHAVRRRRSEPDAREQHAESVRAASGPRRAAVAPGRAGRAGGAPAPPAAGRCGPRARRVRTGRRSCSRKAGATRC